MDLQTVTKHFIPDFGLAMRRHWDAVLFIRRHRLWDGFWKYGWFTWIMVSMGLLFGLKFFLIFWEWAQSLDTANPGAVSANMSRLFSSLSEMGNSLFFLGGLKYLILILTEVMVFHVIRRTMEVLTGEEEDNSFQSFVKAQVRMIKVVIRSWVLELVATILISVAIGIAGLDFLKEPLIFAVQCYFLGFVVVDNYQERYGVSIKESTNRSWLVAGAVTAIGLVTYLLLLVPLIGPILAPFLVSVTAALTLFELEVKGRLPKGVMELEEAFDHK